MKPVKKSKKSSDKEQVIDKDNPDYLLEMKNRLKSMNKEFKELRRIIRRIKKVQEIGETPTTPESNAITLYYLIGDRTTSTDPDTKRIFDATGYFISEKSKSFMVLKGSKVVRDVTPSFISLPSSKKLRKTLIRSGKLVENGDCYEFSEDCLFKSSSAAACVVIGTASSGLKEWKREDGSSVKGEVKAQLKLKI